MTHLFYVPMRQDETMVRCDECSAIIALTSWWEHARWHQSQAEVLRVLVAEAVLDAADEMPDDAERHRLRHGHGVRFGSWEDHEQWHDETEWRRGLRGKLGHAHAEPEDQPAQPDADAEQAAEHPGTEAVLGVPTETVWSVSRGLEQAARGELTSLLTRLLRAGR